MGEICHVRLDAIPWICGTSAPRRDLPSAFGKWNPVWEAPADSGGAPSMSQMIDSTAIRVHRCTAGGEPEGQKLTLGRSRSGFNIKIHVRCNAAGLPVGIALTEGEAHDVTAYEALVVQRESDPAAMLADEGYDSDPPRLAR